jgi:hypothetical protein
MSRILHQYIYRVLTVVGVALILSTTQLSQAQYTWRSVQVYGGGFVPGIIFNTSEQNLVYRENRHRRSLPTRPGNESLGTFARLNQLGRLEPYRVISLATDPVNPNNVYVAAGTYTNSWTTQNGAIFAIFHKGATWQRTMLPFKLGGNMPGRGAGERLVVDPNKNSILFLGAPSGMVFGRVRIPELPGPK